MSLCRFGSLVFLWILSPLFTAGHFAAEPTANESLRYRRVYVPSEDLNSQVRGMIPLKREEFERRVSAWSGGLPDSSASKVRVERAVYGARLAQDQWVDGTSRLQVVSATSDPAILSWENCNLALGKPVWDEQPPRPARMGATSKNRTVFLVEKSGQIIIPWTLRGETGQTQETTFDVRLPQATVNQLVLQVPAVLTLSSDVGIVSRLNLDAPESALVPKSKVGEHVNWLVELGGQRQTRLRLTSPARVARGESVVLVREAATHVLSPVDVSSEFGMQFDIHDAPLRTLRLAVDAGTRVTSVRLGGLPLTWRETEPASPQETALQVDLPEPLAGSGNSLTVSVVSPLPLDRGWRLPRLRLLESTWQEGTAMLVLPSSLQLRGIQFTDARQASLSPGSTTQPERTYQFQYHSPQGQVEIQAGRERPHLVILGGLVVRHEEAQLSAVLNLDLSVDSGERFDLEGLIHEDWVIDSVDTSPTDLLEERQYGDGRSFGLRLRFARPLTAQGKLRLVIRAHRQLPAEGEGITTPSLRLMDFKEVHEEQLLVALRATDGSREFQLFGDLDLFRIDPESAGPEELNLLESSSAGILFRIDRQGEGSRISLVPSDPRFTANVECTARVQLGKIDHQGIARVTPTSSSLARLIIRSSGPVPAAMRWKLVGAGDLTIVSQTLLPSPSSLSSGEAKESVWELVLSRLASQPLTLEATWETPFTPGEVLPLFSFPEATSQDGLLRIEARQGIFFRLETEGVQPVPAPLASEGEYSAVRGLFRYEPGRRASVSLATRSNHEALPAAWAKRCTISTQYSTDGRAAHEITWQLENHGQDRFWFSVPAGARLQQVFVDGEAVPFPTTDALAGRQFISLPEHRRNPIVTLAVYTRSPPRSAILPCRWSAPLVTTSLPVLDRGWRVSLPPGMLPLESGRASSGFSNWYTIWKSRLWGPLQMHAAARDVDDLECSWSESEPLVLWVYSPGLMRLWGLVLTMSAACVMLWWIPNRHGFVAMFAAASACTAVLLPEPYAPLAAGLFWGALFGGVLGLARPSSSARTVASRNSPPSTRAMATTLAGLVLLFAIISCGELSAVAAEGDGVNKGAAAKIHRVVIPIDADSKPVGEYVYVPLEFYTLLFRAPDREQLPAWLIRSAIYELETTPENPATGNFALRLEVETLGANAKVTLPLRRGEVHLLEGRATLDGEPIALDWDESGSSLRMEIEQPGLYQLALGFSAAAKVENQATSWDFAIPQSARAALRIKSVPRPGDWLIPGALGATATEGNDLLVELGPAAALGVSRMNPEKPAPSVTEAEQLVWWKLQPGSVTADFLVRVRPESGTLSEIKLLADPLLRLLPLENETRVSRVWLEEGPVNTHHFVLADPAPGVIELRGKLLLLDSSGIGKLALPRLEVVAQRKTKQWRAISVSKECEITQDPEPPLILRTPVEFVESWGEGPRPPPNLAFDAVGPTPAFLVRPRESAVLAKEFVDVSIGRKDAEIVYQVDLTGVPPHRFHEVIDLPAGFRVKQASILEQDVNIALRAPSEPQGVLIVERRQPPDARERLVIEGTLPLANLPGQSERIYFPKLRAATSEGATIRVYRTPAALLAIKSVAGMTPAAAPEGPPWDPRLGYLVASYKSPAAPQAAARELDVDIKPHSPAAVYRLVTTMERTTARSWSAVVQCGVTVESGELDSIRLEIPAEWSGPFELTPPMDHQVVLLPGQTQRHLVIRPARGNAGSQNIAIRGPVKLQSGESPHAPVLLPLDAERAESFLVLPQRVEEENLQWQTSGLQAISLEDARDAKLAAPGQEVFRIVAPRFNATLLQSKDQRTAARISLADFLVRPTPGGGYWVKASYYLLPGSRGESELQLAADSQLVQVLMNESPAECHRQPDGTWKIRLGHEQLPQKVEVVYEHHPQHEATESWQVSPPRWLGITTAKATWSVLPPQGNAGIIPADVAEADPRQAALTQMAAIIKLVREAGDSGVSGLPARQLAAWLSLWRQEFARASQAAQAVPPSSSPDAAADRLEMERRAFETEFTSTLSRYPDILPISTHSDLPVISSLLLDVPKSLVVQLGEPATLALAPPPASVDSLPRLGLALCLISLTLVPMFLVSTTRLGESLTLTPAFGLALAAAIFLVLMPAGWLVAAPLFAIAAWFSLRRSWPPRRTTS